MITNCHACKYIYKNKSNNGWVVCPNMPVNVFTGDAECENFVEADWVQCLCGHWFIYEHVLGEPAPSCPECGVKAYAVPEVLYMGHGFYCKD